jgi:hypothetical protein
MDNSLSPEWDKVNAARFMAADSLRVVNTRASKTLEKSTIAQGRKNQTIRRVVVLLQMSDRCESLRGLDFSAEFIRSTDVVDIAALLVRWVFDQVNVE